jgi:hypothetical protein
MLTVADPRYHGKNNTGGRTLTASKFAVLFLLYFVIFRYSPHGTWKFEASIRPLGRYDIGTVRVLPIPFIRGGVQDPDPDSVGSESFWIFRILIRNYFCRDPDPSINRQKINKLDFNCFVTS